MLNVDASVALSTLANATILSVDITALGITKFRVVSMDLSWQIRDQTPGEGPIQVGVANSNLTNTEIGECLDATPTSQTDIIPLERLRRPVRTVGAFNSVSADEVLNDGRMMRTKFHTVLDEGTELEVWARNRSGSSLTGGAFLAVQGRVYGYWI